MPLSLLATYAGVGFLYKKYDNTFKVALSPSFD